MCKAIERNELTRYDKENGVHERFMFEDRFGEAQQKIVALRSSMKKDEKPIRS